jgi:hypothetical protein
MVAAVAAPNIKAATLNVNDPESRGVALALQVRAPVRFAVFARPRETEASKVQEQERNLGGPPFTHPPTQHTHAQHTRSLFLSLVHPCPSQTLSPQTMTDDLGKALGPFVVAGFIKHLGRQAAFNISVLGWVPCGLLILALVFFMRRDEVGGRDGGWVGAWVGM